jgi:hypothetical protein
MTDANADALITARAMVADANNPAHRRAILAGDWDNGTLVKAALHKVLTKPEAVAGDE